MIPLKEFRNAWVKATTLGFFSFLLMIPISFFFVKIFHPSQFDGLTLPEMFHQMASKSQLGFGWGFFIVGQIGHFILYLIVGTVLAHLQYKVLKAYIPKKSI